MKRGKKEEEETDVRCIRENKQKKREKDVVASVYEGRNIYNIATVHNKCAKNWKQTV